MTTTPNKNSKPLYQADAAADDAADNTTRNFKNSRQKLVDYFNADKPLHEISPGGADDWRQWLAKKKYSDSTISKAVKHAKHFLLMAKRKGLMRANPFQHLKAGGEENEARKEFVEQRTIDRVIEQAPDTQWKLIITLARYGGLRRPSEVLALTWNDVDWGARKITVSSRKTKRQGKAFRVFPLFPELRPLLEKAFDEAEEGTLHIITKYRRPNSNLRTQFERILKKAGDAIGQATFDFDTTHSTSLNQFRYNEAAAEETLRLNDATVAHQFYDTAAAAGATFKGAVSQAAKTRVDALAAASKTFKNSTTTAIANWQTGSSAVVSTYTSDWNDATVDLATAVNAASATFHADYGLAIKNWVFTVWDPLTILDPTTVSRHEFALIESGGSSEYGGAAALVYEEALIRKSMQTTVAQARADEVADWASQELTAWSAYRDAEAAERLDFVTDSSVANHALKDSLTGASVIWVNAEVDAREDFENSIADAKTTRAAGVADAMSDALVAYAEAIRDYQVGMAAATEVITATMATAEVGRVMVVGSAAEVFQNSVAIAAVSRSDDEAEAATDLASDLDDARDTFVAADAAAQRTFAEAVADGQKTQNDTMAAAAQTLQLASTASDTTYEAAAAPAWAVYKIAVNDLDRQLVVDGEADLQTNKQTRAALQQTLAESIRDLGGRIDMQRRIAEVEKRAQLAIIAAIGGSMIAKAQADKAAHEALPFAAFSDVHPQQFRSWWDRAKSLALTAGIVILNVAAWVFNPFFGAAVTALTFGYGAYSSYTYRNAQFNETYGRDMTGREVFMYVGADMTGISAVVSIFRGVDIVTGKEIGWEDQVETFLHLAVGVIAGRLAPRVFHTARIFAVLTEIDLKTAWILSRYSTKYGAIFGDRVVEGGTWKNFWKPQFKNLWNNTKRTVKREGTKYASENTDKNFRGKPDPTTGLYGLSDDLDMATITKLSWQQRTQIAHEINTKCGGLLIDNNRYPVRHSVLPPWNEYSNTTSLKAFRVGFYPPDKNNPGQFLCFRPGNPNTPLLPRLRLTFSEFIGIQRGTNEWRFYF